MVDYSQYKVLIVDDEVEILKALNRGLRTEPYEKLFLDSAQNAIELFATEEIAVIVTDMRMPGMNGLELLEFINKVSPETVKIVLTGYTQLTQILVTVNKIDIFKFLTKPWDLEAELKVYIREAIEIYHERKNKDSKGKSLELKNELYQKLLSEGYEKVDYFLKLYEEIIKTINYHHLLTTEDLRKFSKDLNMYADIDESQIIITSYDKEKMIAGLMHKMNIRMNYINKVFDYSKYSLRAFDLYNIKDFIVKNYQLADVLEIQEPEGGVTYYDNFKQFTGLIGEIIENINTHDSFVRQMVIRGDKSNEKNVIIFKIVCPESSRMKYFLEEYGQFINIIVKCVGGISEITPHNGEYHVSVIIVAKEKTPDTMAIKTGSASE